MQRTETKQDHTSWEDVIPEEITTDIFYRLPAKSLGRCQLVSKAWYVIISNPRFVNSHALASRNAQTTILYWNHNIYTTLKLWDSECVVSQGSYPTLFVYRDPMSPCSIIGSSHGLICLTIEGDDSLLLFYLGNPITKKSMEIPYPPSFGKFDHHKYINNTQASWFGFVPSIEDYKIVLVLYDSDEICSDEEPQCPIVIKVYVYSVRKAAWRKLKTRMASDMFNGLKACRYSSSYSTCTPLCFNNVLHFIPNRGIFLIYYFDLIKETTIEIITKAFSVHDDPRLQQASQTIGVIEDKLCVCRFYDWYYNKLMMLEVWMLEQYGEWDSWKKLYKVDLGNSFKKDSFYSNFLGFTLTGQVLVYFHKEGKEGTARLTDEYKLLVFDPMTQCYYVHGTTIRLVGYDMANFVESLISPFAIGVTDASDN